MNKVPAMTMIGWDTRNWRHHDKAGIACKDFGLEPITKMVWIGEIYEHERSKIRKRLSDIFLKKTEKFFVLSMCRSCFNESAADPVISRNVKIRKPFVLIQSTKQA